MIKHIVLQSSSPPFLLAAAMETMSCYWLHMPLSSILQTGHPLIIIGHLATESLQNIAIKALMVLVNRKVCMWLLNWGLLIIVAAYIVIRMILILIIRNAIRC